MPRILLAFLFTLGLIQFARVEQAFSSGKFMVAQELLCDSEEVIRKIRDRFKGEE